MAWPLHSSPPFLYSSKGRALEHSLRSCYTCGSCSCCAACSLRSHALTPVFPYAVVNVSPDQFSSLQGGLTGSNVVDHIEEDQEVRTQ